MKLMPYEFLDRFLSKQSGVRLIPNGVKFTLVEPKAPNKSYVDIVLPDGFVIEFDSNFPQMDTRNSRSIFSGYRGNRKRCDYIIVQKNGSSADIYVVEMKSFPTKFSPIRRQLQSSIAFVASCLRSAVDKNWQTLDDYHCYAVVLTHTASYYGSGENAVNKLIAYRRWLSGCSGVLCVRNHTVTMKDLRSVAKPITFDWGQRNDFPEYRQLIHTANWADLLAK